MTESRDITPTGELRRDYVAQRSDGRWEAAWQDQDDIYYGFGDTSGEALVALDNNLRARGK